jgi:hypothetical protein
MQPRVLLDGLAMPESPRWHDGRLWFSNWGTRQIVAVDLDGNSDIVGEGPYGLGWATVGYRRSAVPARAYAVACWARMSRSSCSAGSAAASSDALSRLQSRPWMSVTVAPASLATRLPAAAWTADVQNST